MSASVRPMTSIAVYASPSGGPAKDASAGHQAQEDGDDRTPYMAANCADK
jgi:hypothetical protein